MGAQPAIRVKYTRYLVLGFSLGQWGSPWFTHSRDQPPYIVCTTGLKNARITCLRLPNKGREGPENFGSWRPCIEVDQNSLNKARYILSGFEGLFTQIFHGRIDDLLLQILPSKFIKSRAIVAQEWIEWVKMRAHKRAEFYLENTFENQLWSFTQVADILVAFLFFQLPTLLQSKWLYPACGFFQAACRTLHSPATQSMTYFADDKCPSNMNAIEPTSKMWYSAPSE